METKNRQFKKSAFTLVELLIVISVIVVLISLLLPALGKAKEQTRRIACANNVKQIGTAFLMYIQDNNDYLPPYRDYAAVNEKSWLGATETNGFLAQYLGLNDTYAHIGMTGVSSGKMRRSKFRCASQIEQTAIYYSYGYNQCIDALKLTRFKTPSETCILAECGDIGNVAYIYYDGSHDPAVRHSNGTNAVFADFHIGWKKHAETVYISTIQSLKNFWLSGDN